MLGCDAKGRPIGMADEIPVECGVMLCAAGKLDVLRAAPKRPCLELPFGVWMALAKATPILNLELLGDGRLNQAGLMGGGETDF